MKSIQDEDRLKENSDILYSVCKFMLSRKFDDKEKYVDLISVMFEPDEAIEHAKSIVHIPDKKMKKYFKSEEFQKSGGFGDVFVAKDTLLKKKIVIKKLLHRPKDEKYNYSEIGFLSLVNHPNIVEYISSWEVINPKDENKEIWIIMEFLEGGTLSEVAEKFSLDDDHVAFVAEQILQAVKYLHSINYIHRDLKSANIMFSIEGKVKLIDFGLCTDISKGPNTKMLGSPYWIPPEMIFGVPHSFPVDIWSLGVCLLELFLLKPPYYGNALRCMFETATVGLVHCIPDKVSSNAKDFLKKCLTQNPKNRPCAEDLLKHRWVSNTSNLSEGFRIIMQSIFLGTTLKSLFY